MKRRSTIRAGFSLVELVIAVTLFAMLMASVVLVARSSDRAYRTGATVAHMEAQVAMAVQRIVSELSSAGIDTFAALPAPGVATDQLQYLNAVDFDGAQVLWSAPRRLALELEPGELDDGLDNNGNGLVDERCVVLTENLGLLNERRLVLTRWVPELAEGELANGADDDGNGLVDEPGFSVERIGETLIVRLSLQKRDSEGRLLNRSASTSTRIRNRQASGGGP